MPAGGRVGDAQGTVCKILGQEDVKPHKVRYYLERRDADFEQKMAEVLCVYREVQVLKKVFRDAPGRRRVFLQASTSAVSRLLMSRQCFRRIAFVLPLRKGTMCLIWDNYPPHSTWRVCNTRLVARKKSQLTQRSTGKRFCVLMKVRLLPTEIVARLREPLRPRRKATNIILAGAMGPYQH
jgi:hypothetical protein